MAELVQIRGSNPLKPQGDEPQVVGTVEDGDGRNRLAIHIEGTINAANPAYYAQGLPNSCNAAFPIFIADRNYTITSARADVGTAEGGALTLQISKDDGAAGDAAGAGTSILSSAFNLNSATTQVGTLVSNATALNVNANDLISWVPSANMNTVAGLVVTIGLHHRT